MYEKTDLEAAEARETKKSSTGFAFSGKVVKLLNEKYSRELEKCKTPKEIAKLLENISTKERLRIRNV